MFNLKRSETKQKPKDTEFINSLILITGYLFIQLLSNLTVGKFTALPGDLAIPIGSLLYGVSFTWIDLVNDYLGKERARKLVIIGIVANIFTIAWFQLYIYLPGAAWWSVDPFPQQAIQYAFGGYWRVYVASITTSFISENLDITIFHFVRWNFPKVPRWVRSLSSNLVSAPLDTALFYSLAFAGTMNLPELGAIILGGAIFKLMVGIISIPLLYLVKARHERLALGFRSED